MRKNYYYILYTIRFYETEDGRFFDESLAIPIKTTKQFDDDDWEELGLEAYKQGLIDDEELEYVDDLEPISRKEYQEMINYN